MDIPWDPEATKTALCTHGGAKEYPKSRMALEEPWRILVWL